MPRVYVTGGRNRRGREYTVRGRRHVRNLHYGARFHGQYRRHRFGKFFETQNASAIGRRVKDPFPEKQIVYMRYATGAYALQSGALGATSSPQRFMLNDMNDPDLTGVGHQPYGHDQLATIYKNCLVLGCMYRVRCMLPPTEGCFMAMQITDQGTYSSLAGLDYGYIKEMGNVATKFLPYNQGKPAVFKGYVDLARVFGISRKHYFNAANNGYGHAFGSTPTFSSTLNLYTGTVTGAQQTLTFVIELCYKVLVYDCKMNIGQS